MDTTQGVKIYDTHSQMRIVFVDRPADSPRADLFKCNLYWQDDSTLLIAWADQIKVARIRDRPRTATTTANTPPLIVEITAVFQLDCMVAGIVPHPLPQLPSMGGPPLEVPAPLNATVNPPKSITAFLVIAYTPPDTSFLSGNEVATSRAEAARKAAERPELRIINRAGEELAADALSITNFERCGCNDYVLIDIPDETAGSVSSYVVLSPKDIVVVRPRDWRDHVTWLVERARYQEALEELERRTAGRDKEDGEDGVDAVAIGQKYIEHLVHEGGVVWPWMFSN